MPDKYQSYRNNPDSLGRRLRSSAGFPFTMPDNAKVCWFDADGTIAVTDEDDSNALSGIAVKGGSPLPFLPEKVTSVSGGPTKIFYVI